MPTQANTLPLPVLLLHTLALALVLGATTPLAAEELNDEAPAQTLTTTDDERDAEPSDVQAATPAAGSEGDEERSVRRRRIAEISELRASYERFDSQRERAEFSGVQDDRVNQQDSSTLGFRFDGRLTFEERPAITYLGLLSVYRRQRIEGQGDPTELEDIIRIDAGTDVRSLGVRLWTRGELMPSLSGRYTTEFTPEPRFDAEGEEVDRARRQVIRGNLGGVARFDADLQELRLGGFVEHNFGVLEPYTVAGLSLSAIHERDMEVLRWRNTLEADYFFPSDRDSAKNLRFTLAARTSASVPLFAGLRLGAFASIYVFQGAIEETDDVVFTSIVGLDLGFSGRREVIVYDDPVVEPGS